MQHIFNKTIRLGGKKEEGESEGEKREWGREYCAQFLICMYYKISNIGKCDHRKEYTL